MTTLLQTIAQQKREIEHLTRVETTRIRPYGNVTLYVRSDGNDGNTGLTNDAAGAFLTIQRAVDVACNTYDGGGYSCTIQVQDGTWAFSASLVLHPHRWIGGLTLQGNPAAPANCVLRADTNGMWLVLAQQPSAAPWHLNGFKVAINAGVNSNLILVRWRAHLLLSNMEFGAAGTGAHIYSVEQSLVALQTNYTISGGAAYHMIADRLAIIEDPGSAITATITGTPTFTIFAFSVHSQIKVPLITFSGAVNAATKQYEANILGEVNGTFPGGVAGTTSANGVKI